MTDIDGKSVGKKSSVSIHQPKVQRPNVQKMKLMDLPPPDDDETEENVFKPNKMLKEQTGQSINASFRSNNLNRM